MSDRNVRLEVRGALRRAGLTWRQWRVAVDQGYRPVITVVPCATQDACWHVLAILVSRN